MRLFVCAWLFAAGVFVAPSYGAWNGIHSGSEDIDQTYFMSRSSNFVWVQIAVVKDGSEIPLEDASITYANQVFKPGSHITEQDGRRVPTGEIEVGYSEFCASYEGRTVCKAYHFKPIMRKKDYSDAFIEFMTTGGYSMFNVIRITFDLSD